MAAAAEEVLPARRLQAHRARQEAKEGSAESADALRQAIARDYSESDFREAASLAEAESAIRAGATPDLVLLDLHMPGMRGFTGLAYLRSQFPAVPVAMISADSSLQSLRIAGTTSL